MINVMPVFCHCEVSDHLVDNNAQEALPAIAGYSLVYIRSHNLGICPKFEAPNIVMLELKGCGVLFRRL
ncbi:hypothetical protein MKX03_025943 [Papaver bracteatum]|nr:hypothetical protein MKX03_025943 [Papaver bracteatum]